MRIFRILTGLLALVLIAWGLFFLVRFLGSSSPSPSGNDSATSTTSTQPTPSGFQKSGYLTINNPGLKPNTWYLLSEQPGQPAIATELLFTLSSQCVWYSDDSLTCDAFLLHAGTLVTVTGTPQGNATVVDRLSFNEPQPAEQDIKLFYYNEAKDRELGGGTNPLCAAESIQPVTRRIAITKTPIQDSIRLLLQGYTSPDERNRGFKTEFPLSGVRLEGANLKDGILTLAFSDPERRTTGGSCRVGILWEQIRQTALQFPQVTEVRFSPTDLFQP